MLLRNGPSGSPEVFMLRRTPRMAFAPGAFVFPGGRVDAADADPEVGWTGTPPEEFGAAFGVPAERVRAAACAAVRETFEECGVLLAGPKEPSAVSSDGQADEQARRALGAGELTLARFLSERELTLNGDTLVPWARWITPEIEPRRYDTFFFVAALPDGQVADGGLHDGGEADAAGWLTPMAALDAARAGTALMLPPTAVCLAELADAGDIAEILSAERDIRPLAPQVDVDSEGTWLVIPDGVEYPL
jgi:8-oxo-dGTP pyrophosphatase MutT (NUDIX family)